MNFKEDFITMILDLLKLICYVTMKSIMCRLSHGTKIFLNVKNLVYFFKKVTLLPQSCKMLRTKFKFMIFKQHISTQNLNQTIFRYILQQCQIILSGIVCFSLFGNGYEKSLLLLCNICKFFVPLKVFSCFLNSKINTQHQKIFLRISLLSRVFPLCISVCDLEKKIYFIKVKMCGKLNVSKHL